MSTSKKLLFWISGSRLPLLNLVAALITCAVIMARRDWVLAPPTFARLLDIIARVSVVYFLLAFYARPLDELLHNATTRWMVKNRRSIGLSFAAWFLQHLWILPMWGYPLFNKFWMAGRLVYAATTILLITTQVLTSTDRARRSLPGWKTIHWISIQATWLWFVVIYIMVWQQKREPYQLVYLVLFSVGQLLRIALFTRRMLRDRRSNTPTGGVNGLKIFAGVVFAPGAIALVWSAYMAPSTYVHNYIQLAGFAAVGIGAVLWHLGSSKPVTPSDTSGSRLDPDRDLTQDHPAR